VPIWKQLYKNEDEGREYAITKKDVSLNRAAACLCVVGRTYELDRTCNRKKIMQSFRIIQRLVP